MDVVDGCAPFVLTMTLEYSPDDTESLLGFKPQNGTNYYGLYDFPDKSYYYNIMRSEQNTSTLNVRDNLCQLLTQLYRVCRVSEANRTRYRTHVR